ncbi:MAG: RraA family protein [Betaproteobacteria bacterium]|nr:RraA family protein [Betaproteobacteria bacterium]
MTGNTLGFGIWESRRDDAGPAVRALTGLSVSHLSDVLHRSRTTGTLRPHALPSARLCGPALTVRVAVGDHLMVHKALDLARPGDVVVVDARGYVEAAMIGEIMTRYARSRGIAGFVIDGAIRDLDYITSQDMPVYARGATPAGPTRRGPGEINVTVQVGGMVVAPGDIVCGDPDGVVSVPADAAEAVAGQVAGLIARERAAIAAIEAGSLDRNWIDDALRANGLG